MHSESIKSKKEIMTDSLPYPMKDTLMACFCRFLGNPETKDERMRVRMHIVKYLSKEVQLVDGRFVVRNSRENYVEDKYLFCKGFSECFGINVNLLGEDAFFDVGSVYTIYLRHTPELKFRLVLPAARPKRPDNEMMYDLRVCEENTCHTVGSFSPHGDHQLHQLRFIPSKPDKMYTIHPHRSMGQYIVNVPVGKTMFIYLDGKCVSTLRNGDDVHPYFFIHQHGKHVELAILIAETKKKADQYMHMEIHGVI